MLVLGIDPGTANTGLVLADKSGIRAAATIRTKPGSLRDFAELIMRGRDVRSQVVAAVADNPIGTPDVAAVEAYKDYGGGHLREATRRYYTPNTIAFIDQALETAGIPVTYQDPSEVKRCCKTYRELWKAGRNEVFHNDWLLRNEHLRDAALQAIFYLQGVHHDR